MKINIYYGGRGLIGDPTLYVVKKIMQVLEELNVHVERYDLYDQKNNITTLPQSLKEADGVILATTVEWHGVGGYMMSFLDACWLFGDKEKIRKIYMAPVVMSTTYGEKEAELDLTSAWESLGGITCKGLCGYIGDIAELECNEAYQKLIEKSTENIYRSINQKSPTLPVSTQAVTQKVYKTRDNLLTQQETEQLSEYVSDDSYVEKQKEDIKELTSIFKEILGSETKSSAGNMLDDFRKHFKAQAETHLKFRLNVKKKEKPIAIRVENAALDISYGEMVYPDVELTLEEEVLGEIIEGRKTFQGGFMEGSIISKGEFRNLRMLDTLFPFMEDAEKK